MVARSVPTAPKREPQRPRCPRARTRACACRRPTRVALSALTSPKIVPRIQLTLVTLVLYNVGSSGKRLEAETMTRARATTLLSPPAPEAAATSTARSEAPGVLGDRQRSMLALAVAFSAMTPPFPTPEEVARARARGLRVFRIYKPFHRRGEAPAACWTTISAANLREALNRGDGLMGYQVGGVGGMSAGPARI